MERINLTLGMDIQLKCYQKHFANIELIVRIHRDMGKNSYILLCMGKIVDIKIINLQKKASF